ncbi:glycosyltransferase [Salinimicrobium xinjiangense]|uniref:glycosyltransferase n=1 Tax=Salinimicrobium xinjiangense TaxID=438596 RepID=UPI00040D5FB9|nr:glycosyltransferase [Salinimicrobium xinjiangense]
MSKIKILHIIKSLGRGGAEMLLPETLSLHNNSQFEFHYIYFLPWKDQMVQTIKRHGGKVTCFPVKNNLSLLLQTSKVSHYCRKEKIDVIHCHLPWSGFLGRLVHLKTQIPLLYTEHNIQERYHFATRSLNKMSFNSQNMVLGVSEDVSTSIRNNIEPTIPVRTLLNGVNTAKFKRNDKRRVEIRDQFAIPQDAIVVGNIAVFREQKNIPLWLKAFSEIAQNSENVFGILVGAGPEEEKIKSMIRELGLEKHVVLPGLQTDTVAYFSAMDIFMMSSDFEGLPVALLEAMSMQCAVVSTKAGGVVEVVRDGIDGMLCEVGDKRCLADQVLVLVQDYAQREKMQSAARERVVEGFSLRGMVDELEEIYCEVLKK